MNKNTTIMSITNKFDYVYRVRFNINMTLSTCQFSNIYLFNEDVYAARTLACWPSDIFFLVFILQLICIAFREDTIVINWKEMYIIS